MTSLELEIAEALAIESTDPALALSVESGVSLDVDGGTILEVSRGLVLEFARGPGLPTPLPLTDKGDLLSHDGATLLRVPVGADKRLLSADSGEAAGLLWTPPPPKPTSFFLQNPSASENIDGFRVYTETTVRGINAVLNGSASPSVDFRVSFGPDRSAAGTEILTGGRTVTSTTTGTAYVPDVTTIPAGSWVWLKTTAKSGTVLGLTVALDLTP